jgi:protein-S-isoprenylcysteine O-methyltransferase Ste14
MSCHSSGDTHKDKHGAEGLSFAAAGTLLLLCWGLLWVVGKPTWMLLVYAGWAFLAAGLVFIACPLLLLPRRGKAPQGGGVTQTTVVVRSGLCSVIRHPLYLGWILVFLALILLAQHWLIVLLAIPGIAAVCQITIQEESRLVPKFGHEYERYLKDVPRLNLLAGVIRMVRRGRTK